LLCSDGLAVGQADRRAHNELLWRQAGLNGSTAHWRAGRILGDDGEITIPATK
jgi:hypothetical protein